MLVVFENKKVAQTSAARQAGFLEEVLLELGLKGGLGPMEKALFLLASHLAGPHHPALGTRWRREINEQVCLVSVPPTGGSALG